KILSVVRFGPMVSRRFDAAEKPQALQGNWLFLAQMARHGLTCQNIKGRQLTATSTHMRFSAFAPIAVIAKTSLGSKTQSAQSNYLTVVSCSLSFPTTSFGLDKLTATCTVKF